MSLTIACIGPSDSLAVIGEAFGRFFPNLGFRAYVRERTEDSWEVLEQSQSECDGILFSGIGVQEAAKARGSVTKPHAQIERGAYSLLRVFSEIQRSGQPFGRVSIDVVADQVLREVIREFGVPFDQVHSMPFAVHHREQEYRDRHRELLDSGQADLAITGFGSVFRELQDTGYPVFRMLPSALQVRETVELLLADISTRNLRSAGIAIQIVRLHGEAEQSVNQYDQMKDEGRFYLQLLEYVRMIQGSLFSFGKREYVIFSTRGVIESPVHLDMFTRLLAWGRNNNLLFSSGIGIGATAFEAEKAARNALANGRRLPQGGVFLMHGEQLRGPLGESDELRFRTRVQDAAQLRMAEEIGISPSALDRIRSIMESTGKSTFDSADLAACLGISERSARRMLKKFLDGGHARLVGKENAHQVGRPKNLVRLMI
ncbi:hypothetical protein [Paucidesulfovibrio longus]|uniref:hypothetical protein n=1 Tax=Paucidesulfovibrio longus TaxID=889 RepID=UPI0003B5479C|nr:hypothetical protein [Paucidesulfovibrio longus]